MGLGVLGAFKRGGRYLWQFRFYRKGLRYVAGLFYVYISSFRDLVEVNMRNSNTITSKVVLDLQIHFHQQEAVGRGRGAENINTFLEMAYRVQS